MSERLAVAALAAVLSLSAQPVSREKQAMIGEHMAAEFERSTTAIDNPVVQIYLDRLIARLAVHSPATAFPLTLRAVVDDRCSLLSEPVTYPGGHIFISAVLMAAVEDEAELAALLAHAIYHVDRPFEFSQAAGRIANVPLVFAAVSGCRSGLAIPLRMAAERQKHEMDADAFAVATLSAAGFDPSAMSRYLERLPATTLTRSLGRAQARIDALRTLLEPQSAADVIVSGDAFVAMQSAVRTLFDPPRQRVKPPSLNRN